MIRYSIEIVKETNLEKIRKVKERSKNSEKIVDATENAKSNLMELISQINLLDNKEKIGREEI